MGRTGLLRQDLIHQVAAGGNDIFAYAVRIALAVIVNPEFFIHQPFTGPVAFYAFIYVNKTGICHLHHISQAISRDL
ncbi:hypothetical protein D9M69_644190 [compost metagenome]